MASDIQQLGSDLTLYAVRLVRLLRREVPQPVGMRVLSILDESGPLGVTRLATIDQCSQPTMSGIVHGLAERGWVVKQPDPADARSNHVSLTAAGRAVLSEVRAANGAAIAEHLARSEVTAADLATAISVLRTVLQPQEVHLS